MNCRNIKYALSTGFSLNVALKKINRLPTVNIALTILFLVLSTLASATDYYISSSGNDANTGLTTSTPWKTIAKVNAAFSIVKPGDRILFNRGDVFTGQITLTCSGSSSAKITLSAYGIGNAPVIQGNVEIGPWTRSDGNIWVANCPQLGSSVSNLLINGKSQQIGRYPNSDQINKGYLSIKSHSGKTQLMCSSLESSLNWTGGEAVVRSARWVLDRVPIQSHQGEGLVFSKPTTYDIKDNFGFFIQNHLNTLDKAGEWYFDSAKKKMYLYWSSDPNLLLTEASAFSSTFLANGQKYFLIDNIEFRGSFKTNINITNSSWVEIINSKISESGNDAVYFSFCTHINFNNNKIINTNSSAINFLFSNNIVINSNQIQNTALRAGMGTQYTGISMFWQVNNYHFENNLIDSIGYNGIYFGGDTVTIRNNVINHFCMTIDDGGGLYHGSNNGNIVKVENNLVLNGIGAGEGTDNPARNGAEGIYMDIKSANVAIIGNTVSNCNSGIFIYHANHIPVIGNTLYNNNIQLRFSFGNEFPIDPINNCIVNNNIFFAKSPLQIVADFRTIDNDIQNFGIFDNNYYCRPINDKATIMTEYVGNLGIISKLIDLSTWQATFNHDLNSKKSPLTISPDKIENSILFAYNPNSTDVTINDGNHYIDVKEIKYSGSIKLLPFTSVVLMVDPNPDQPIIPVYVSSSVGNASPFLLEMTYNLSLANTVPAVSVFSVQVNSLARMFNYVTISGTKVQLTLASPVAYGDIVTVAYTKPSSNQIQTTSAGQAASFNAQTVTNNCLKIVGKNDLLDTLVDTKKKKIRIYPNPAHDFFIISFDDPIVEPKNLKIIDLSGKIVLTELIEQGIKNIQIPLNFKSGNYIVALESNNKIYFTQKLIILQLQ